MVSVGRVMCGWSTTYTVSISVSGQALSTAILIWRVSTAVNGNTNASLSKEVKVLSSMVQVIGKFSQLPSV